MTETKQTVTRWLAAQKQFLAQARAFSLRANWRVKASIDKEIERINSSIVIFNQALPWHVNTSDDPLSEDTKERVFGLACDVLDAWKTFVCFAVEAQRNFLAVETMGVDALRVDVSDTFKDVILVHTRTEAVRLMQREEPRIGILGLHIEDLLKHFPEFFDEDEPGVLKRLAGDSTKMHDIAPYTARDERSDEMGMVLVLSRPATA